MEVKEGGKKEKIDQITILRIAKGLTKAAISHALMGRLKHSEQNNGNESG